MSQKNNVQYIRVNLKFGIIRMFISFRKPNLHKLVQEIKA